MHRTLKREVAIAADLGGQQRAFDHWRREFNEERPLEALGQRPPARIYVPCSNHYPRPLIHPEPCEWRRSFRLDRDGFIRVARRKVFITSALRHLHVSLERVTETACEVRWGEIVLGRINERELERGIIPARRKRGDVSTLSLK